MICPTKVKTEPKGIFYTLTLKLQNCMRVFSQVREEKTDFRAIAQVHDLFSSPVRGERSFPGKYSPHTLGVSDHAEAHGVAASVSGTVAESKHVGGT